MNGGQPHQQSYTETANYDSRNGGSMIRESRETGQPTLTETREIDPTGRQLGAGSTGGAQTRIEDVTDSDQAARDRLYEERMEDEYAKREGGA